MKLDLNCDLGELEPPARTRALMRWVTSANIACGGHAGDARTMERCIMLSKEHRVRAGAHPGPWDRDNAGRSHVDITPRDLELLLLHQVGALDAVARRHGVRLHHIKLHGALYHAAERSDAIAEAYVATVAQFWPRLIIFALAGGRVSQLARMRGSPVWGEAFADRGYRDDGTLVPRSEVGALITRASAAAARIRGLTTGRGIETVSGHWIRVRADTVCIHGDTPGAAGIARQIRSML